MLTCGSPCLLPLIIAARMNIMHDMSITPNASNATISSADILHSLDEFLIQNRNRRITEELRRNGRDIRIFCVSNDMYSNNRRDTMPHSEDYFNLSGIPELRRYCQLVPAEARFLFVVSLLQNRVPAVLGSIKQWALAGLDNVTAEKALTLRHVLSNIELGFQEVWILLCRMLFSPG